jgi:hypothetical protein
MPEATPDATPDVVPDAVPDAVPAEEAPASAAPVDVAAQLKAQFPALFTGAHKPLKLRIQADIQERAPGQFTKTQLSAFFRRYTGNTGYLIALTKAAQRFDLDGKEAGEISDEHRNAAKEELVRRRGVQQERVALEQQQRFNRAGLLRDYERTTLTLANFCVLKGTTEEELPGLLEIARKEAAEMPQREERPRFEPRGDRRDQRDNRGDPREQRGPRGPRPPQKPRG